MRPSYTQAAQGSATAVDTLQSFFRQTLRIPDLSPRHIMDELETLKESGSEPTTAAMLYSMLECQTQRKAPGTEGLR